MALVVLALMLLWRVYVHHTRALPYADEPDVVLLYNSVNKPASEVVKIADAWS